MIRWEHAPGPYEVVFSTREGGVSEGPFASLNLGRATADELLSQWPAGRVIGVVFAAPSERKMMTFWTAPRPFRSSSYCASSSARA